MYTVWGCILQNCNTSPPKLTRPFALVTWQRGAHPAFLGNATLEVVKEVKEEDGTVVKEVVKSFPLLGEEPLSKKPVNTHWLLTCR